MNKKIIPLVLVLLVISVGLVFAFSSKKGKSPNEVMKSSLVKYNKWQAKYGTEVARGKLVADLKKTEEVESVNGKLGDITVNFKNGEKHLIIGTTLDQGKSKEPRFGKPGTECGNGVCEPSENKNNCPEDCSDGEETTTTTTETTTTTIEETTTTSTSTTTTTIGEEIKPYEATAVIFDPFEWEGGVFSNPELISSITQNLENEGYETVSYQNNEVKLELLKTNMLTGVVFNRGHGGVFDTGEVVILTNEVSNTETKNKYSEDFENNRVYTCWMQDLNRAYHSKICYGPKFVEYYYSDLPNSLIYMESCEGLANPSMANAFLNVGSGTYVGWDQSVTVSGGDDAADENFYDLTVLEETVHKTVSETPKDGHGRWAAKLGYKGEGELKV